VGVVHIVVLLFLAPCSFTVIRNIVPLSSGLKDLVWMWHWNVSTGSKCNKTTICRM